MSEKSSALCHATLAA